MNKLNPFKPLSPVPPGMFVGRIDEIFSLEKMLFQTKNGNSVNFLLTGERGVGKTSLMLYIKHVAKGGFTVDDEKYNFLVIDIDIDPSVTKVGLIKKIELGLKRALNLDEPSRKFFEDAWNFLQRLEISGIKINPQSKNHNEETLLDEFTYAFIDTVGKVASSKKEADKIYPSYDGVLVLIDEADNASSSLELGSFVKLFTEKLHRSGCNKVMLGMAGLPTLRKILISSHESSLRVFNEFPLDRLNHDEVNKVIDICLENANEINSNNTSIDEEGREFLITLSEGYPHFIQQYGYSAFDVDTDDVIDIDDVIKGAIGEHGALNQIGTRYYHDDFYRRIQKNSYRQVLRIMADKLDDWVSKKEIRSKFKGKDSDLDNAIKALKERHLILPKEGERGWYRLQYKGFALWIKYETMDPELLEAEKNN